MSKGWKPGQWTEGELIKIFDRHAADLEKIEKQFPDAQIMISVDETRKKPEFLVIFDEALKGSIDVSGIPKSLGKGKDKIGVKVEWMPPVIAL
ncbi:MAG: hypothetical protein HY370_08945 [Proteobacteria bacterium]|nr:hypothetical protein [Pseudomonadota bacterium]